MRVIGIGAAIVLLALMSCGVRSCLAIDYAFNYNNTSGNIARFFAGLGQIELLVGAIVIVVGTVMAIKATPRSGD